MKRLYLAGPCGFSEIGSMGLTSIEKILNQYFLVINPFITSSEEGKQILSLQEKLHTSIGYSEIKAQLQQINMKIGKKNTELIDSCDIIFAILDGADVDSGTSAEIGYAFSRGKLILGYRGDFRLSADNFGSIINLQVEYFIRASGGCIFSSIRDIELSIARYSK